MTTGDCLWTGAHPVIGSFGRLRLGRKKRQPWNNLKSSLLAHQIQQHHPCPRPHLISAITAIVRLNGDTLVVC